MAEIWQARNASEQAAADDAVKFIGHLRHGKGKWVGQPFTLLPWQEQEFIRPLFGALRPDGLRQYRTAYVEVPRKAGKSQIAAGVGLKLLLADGEAEGEIYLAASDRDQASIVFRAAAQMVRTSPRLRALCHVIDHTRTIAVTKGPYAGSFLRAIAADASGSHGFNASGVVADEVHTWRDRELWDVLSTSMGARTQPLMLAITTAGYDRTSLCWELHEHARQVRDGYLDDPSFLPVLYGAQEGDDWLDPKVWRKAHPSLGVTVQEDWLASEAKRAEQMPGYQNAFRRLYLNEWTAGESRWLNMGLWDACSLPLPESLEARPCYAGLDLASVRDLTALVLIFPPDDPEQGTFHVLPHFWIPEEGLQARVRRDRVPYDVWRDQGLLTVTEGNATDYLAIERHIQAASLKYELRELAVDRAWNAEYVSQRLGDAGVSIVPFGQGYMSMTWPTKELERLVLQRRLAHGGNPILRWMADNVQVEQDAAGNLKPSKSKSTEKIDGIVATIMGLDRALRGEGSTRSVYEDRGIISL